VLIAVGVNDSLNLYVSLPSSCGQGNREVQIETTKSAPSPIGPVSFARFIPPLHEIVLHVGDCGAMQFNVEIVILARPVVLRSGQRMWIKIETSQNRRSRPYGQRPQPRVSGAGSTLGGPGSSEC